MHIEVKGKELEYQQAHSEPQRKAGIISEISMYFDWKDINNTTLQPQVYSAKQDFGLSRCIMNIACYTSNR